MDLRTHTSLWRMEKRLYKFYDISLPYPVSIRQIGFFFGTLIPWLFLMNLLGVPFKPPWNALWLAPPFAAAWAANRPVAEGKTLFAYVWSQITFFFGHREYSHLSPNTGSRAEDEEYVVSATVWMANDKHQNKVRNILSPDAKKKPARKGARKQERSGKVQKMGAVGKPEKKKFFRSGGKKNANVRMSTGGDDGKKQSRRGKKSGKGKTSASVSQ